MLDRIKNIFKKTAPPQHMPLVAARPGKTTTASRRAAQRKLDESRMWVSKAIPEDVATATLLGVSHFIPQIMRKEPGHTLSIGNNLIKNTADKFGRNNKQRRSTRRLIIADRDARVAAQENVH